MNKLSQYCNSSIGRKQIVATTGLLLILFVIGHLAGNLFFYGGPHAYNHYAQVLASLRPLLTFVEYGLLAIFLLHVYFTVFLVMENIHARGGRYAVDKAVGARSFSTRLMPYTGTFLFIYIVWHLMDFTFMKQDGLRNLVNGIDLGLYGVVYNAFTNPLHSLGYILAMGCLGFHLSHGIQSVFQTLGFDNSKCMTTINHVSNFFGLIIAFAYSTIPIIVLLHSTYYKVGSL